MDLKQLRALVTVAETGNVTRASALLNIVQPAVSRQLHLLEKDLGTPLFERGRSGMQLTDAGKTMVEYARRILDEVTRAKAEIRPTEGPVSGIVSIGLLASTSDLLATALVADVAHRYPGIRLRIAIGYAGHLLDWLGSGEVDAALIYGQKVPLGLHIKMLLEEELWVVGPPTAKLNREKPVPLARVARERFILPGARQGLRAMIEHAATSMGLEFDVVAETNALSVQKALVIEGHGWTILPAVGVAEEAARGLLSVAPLSQPSLKRKIVLAAPTNRQATTPVRCVVGILIDCVKKAVDEGKWTGAHWLGG